MFLNYLVPRVSNEPLHRLIFLLALLCTFTYAQLFTYLFIRSLILYLRAKSKKQVIGWDKTVRFKKINKNKHRAPYALCLFIAV